MFSTLSSTGSYQIIKPSPSATLLYYYTFNSSTISGTTINVDPISINTQPLTMSNTLSIISSNPTPKEGDRCFNSGNKLYNAVNLSTMNIPTVKGITVSLWVNSLAAGSTNQQVIGFGVGTTTRTYLFLDGSKTQILVYNHNGTTGGNQISTGNTLSSSVWHHYAFTWTGSTIKIYMNGVLKTNNTSNPITLPNETWTSMAVGKDVGNALGNSYSAIDCVRVYSGVLSLSEIQSIYNAGN
jgi:hypothetical protein